MSARVALDWLNKRDFVQFGLRGLIVPRRVSHVAGPAKIAYGPDELVAVTVMRNGAPWLDVFLEHHRRIGIKHFVVLDNGSTDGSLERLAAQPDVTLLRSSLPYHAYENTLKRYLVRRFCGGRWCLFVDIDELFDYPFSDRFPLRDLLHYLDASGYNAVILQMLDLFGEEPIGAAGPGGASFRDAHRFYDLSVVERSDYGSAENPIKMHVGGIRKKVFGTLNGLTKASLFRLDGKLEPFVTWHHVSHGRYADFSAVLLHYPFVGRFVDKVADAVATGRYGYATDDQYRGYHARLQGAEAVSLFSTDARPFVDAAELVDAGLLVVSDEYRAAAAGVR